LGRKQGFVASIVLIIATILVSKSGIGLPYSLIETRQLLISLFVVTLLVMFYESVNETYEVQNTKNMEINEKRLKVNEDLYQRIKDRNTEIVSKNMDLENIKKAILNILEDEKELQVELKKEKEGIEKKIIERTQELSNEKAKLSASIEALLKAFVMIDLDSNIILTNKNLNALFGNEETWTFNLLQQKLGKNFDLISEYKRCLTDKKRAIFENVVFDTKILEIRLSPIFSVENAENLIGVLIIIGDATEEKILERSKDEFFSIASHELRTPLTAIRGNASMIKQYYSEAVKDEEFKGMIDDIEESSVRLIGIVNDFLNLSRLEQNRMEFKNENFNIVDLCKKAVEQVEATKNKDVIISIDADEAMNVFADKDRTMQVVINLLGNSLKFTEKGTVKISFTKDKDFIKTFVQDSGRGIPLENQKLLFRKFQQAGSSLFTRDTTKGTGLGLYISKLMVEGMKGEIGLEKSEEGKGSIFYFNLPVAKN
jgi:signal transduction histidine kinase